MRFAKTALLLAIFVGCYAPSSFGQTRDRRAFAHAAFGVGSMEDDEGSLGKGLLLGVGLGAEIVDELEAEISVTRMHHQRALAISWEGDLTSVVGRIIYRTGGPGSTSRFFAGVGAGYYSYAGAISETVFPTLSSVPLVERFEYTFRGLTYETGGGLELLAGRNAFIRPELWVMIPRGGRTSGGRTPEPPFLIARGALTAGFRF